MDKYMYVISDNKIGLILNPNAGAEEYYRVAFAPDDIRDVAQVLDGERVPETVRMAVGHAGAVAEPSQERVQRVAVEWRASKKAQQL